MLPPRLAGRSGSARPVRRNPLWRTASMWVSRKYPGIRTPLHPAWRRYSSSRMALLFAVVARCAVSAEAFSVRKELPGHHTGICAPGERKRIAERALRIRIQAVLVFEPRGSLIWIVTRLVDGSLICVPTGSRATHARLCNQSTRRRVVWPAPRSHDLDPSERGGRVLI